MAARENAELIENNKRLKKVNFEVLFEWLRKKRPFRFSLKESETGNEISRLLELFKKQTKKDRLEGPSRRESLKLAELLGGQAEVLLSKEEISKAQKSLQTARVLAESLEDSPEGEVLSKKMKLLGCLLPLSDAENPNQTILSRLEELQEALGGLSAKRTPYLAIVGGLLAVIYLGIHHRLGLKEEESSCSSERVPSLYNLLSHLALRLQTALQLGNLSNKEVSQTDKVVNYLYAHLLAFSRVSPERDPAVLCLALGLSLGWGSLSGAGEACLPPLCSMCCPDLPSLLSFSSSVNAVQSSPSPQQGPWLALNGQLEYQPREEGRKAPRKMPDSFRHNIYLASTVESTAREEISTARLKNICGQKKPLIAQIAVGQTRRTEPLETELSTKRSPQESSNPFKSTFEPPKFILNTSRGSRCLSARPPAPEPSTQPLQSLSPRPSPLETLFGCSPPARAPSPPSSLPLNPTRYSSGFVDMLSAGKLPPGYRHNRLGRQRLRQREAMQAPVDKLKFMFLKPASPRGLQDEESVPRSEEKKSKTEEALISQAQSPRNFKTMELQMVRRASTKSFGSVKFNKVKNELRQSLQNSFQGQEDSKKVFRDDGNITEAVTTIRRSIDQQNMITSRPNNRKNQNPENDKIRFFGKSKIDLKLINQVASRLKRNGFLKTKKFQRESSNPKTLDRLYGSLSPSQRSLKTKRISIHTRKDSSDSKRTHSFGKLKIESKTMSPSKFLSRKDSPILGQNKMFYDVQDPDSNDVSSHRFLQNPARQPTHRSSHPASQTQLQEQRSDSGGSQVKAQRIRMNFHDSQSKDSKGDVSVDYDAKTPMSRFKEQADIEQNKKKLARSGSFLGLSKNHNHNFISSRNFQPNLSKKASFRSSSKYKTLTGITSKQNKKTLAVPEPIDSKDSQIYSDEVGRPSEQPSAKKIPLIRLSKRLKSQRTFLQEDPALNLNSDRLMAKNKGLPLHSDRSRSRSSQRSLQQPHSSQRMAEEEYLGSIRSAQSEQNSYYAEDEAEEEASSSLDRFRAFSTIQLRKLEIGKDKMNKFMKRKMDAKCRMIFFLLEFKIMASQPEYSRNRKIFCSSYRHLPVGWFGESQELNCIPIQVQTNTVSKRTVPRQPKFYKKLM